MPSSKKRSKPKKKRVRITIVVTPSWKQISDLYYKVRSRFPSIGPSEEITARQSALRKISTVFAKELRKRGWLHEEAYAPGSWATPSTGPQRGSPA